MPIYYPSLVVNVKLVFDESLTRVSLPAAVSVEDKVRAPAVQPGRVTYEPLILQRGARNVSYAMAIVPKKGSVELPGYRTAGKFSFDIDFKQLPIDPRTVRAAAVEIHQGTVRAEDFGRGVTSAHGPRSSVLQTRLALDATKPNPDTLVMVGTVDEWSVDHENGSTVTLNGRDMRGILIDIPVGIIPGSSQQLLDSIDLSRPINEVVTTILRFNPEFADFRVVVNAAEWPNGHVPSPNDPNVVPRHRRGARGNKAAGHGTPNSSMDSVNFWDLITRFCFLVGAIPYFRGTELLIRPSRAIFDQQNAGVDPAVNPTPFKGGRKRDVDKPSGQSISPGLSYRRVVFGRDLSKMSFTRKFGGFQRPRIVKAVSMNQSSSATGHSQLVVGRWPPAAAPAGTRRTRVAPNGRESTEEILNIPVAGVSDVARLTEIAKGIYEEMGRGEITGSLETKSVTSFGGTNEDADMLRLQPGDAIDVLVDVRQATSASPVASPVHDLLGTPFEQAVLQVQRRVGDENLARVIVATARGQVQQLQSFFRVASVRYTWSNRGVTVAVDFQNYVVVRAQDTDHVTSRGAGTTTSVPG